MSVYMLPFLKKYFVTNQSAFYTVSLMQRLIIHWSQSLPVNATRKQATHAVTVYFIGGENIQQARKIFS